MSSDWAGLRVIVLGSGTSHGVPMIGCDCPVCTSTDPRDKRTRPSIAIQSGDHTILVDTPPELRLQCVANNIRRADAVLFTHHHADHVTGLDDLRRFNWLMKQPLTCFGLPHTLEVIRRMFRYAFEEVPGYESHKPDLRLVAVDEQPFDIPGGQVIPIPLMHGKLPILGYRFGRFAYCTDCSFISDQSLLLLQDLDLLILDALRKRPHPTHFNLEQAVAAAQRIGAVCTLFTHIAHELKHAETNAELPGGMALAHDGQVIDLKP